MKQIKKQDFINSIYNALQYISYYHPDDFVIAMKKAYENEKSPAAKDALAQILINSRMCAQEHRPICQDTGMVTVFVKYGMNVKWDDSGSSDSLVEMINAGVRLAYADSDNPLRKSVVTPPAGKRINTKDNAPAVVHVEVVPGDKIEINIAAKGGGSENKAKFAVLNPSDDVNEWVLKTIPTLGAGWCPPGIIGIGIGGTPEKAMMLAKESLMEPIDIDEVIAKENRNEIEQRRVDLYNSINKLGIGSQGVGGNITALDVKIMEYPTHAASLPVALIPNCAAARHIHFTLDGSGEAQFPQRDINSWPDVDWNTDNLRKVNIDNISREEINNWQAGETLLISGKILTGRDAAHKRIFDNINSGDALPEGLDFTNRFIYYVGPVDPVGDEVVGPAGPTTATRMDKFTDFMLEKTGLLGMIGKAERGADTINSIKKHKSVYLTAVGGAALLISKSIIASRTVAFADLGMEAVYEFEVKDMPVTVGVSSDGVSVHETGPKQWKVSD